MESTDIEKNRIKNEKITLLFVDDEENILRALKRLFRPLGYQVLLAQSAEVALEMLVKQPIDLIISDMRMPQMDGASFLAIVAKRWPNIVRILLTGYADISTTIKAVNSGKIYRYISKPWEDTDIKLSVKLALEQKQIQVERDQLQNLTRKQNKQLKEFNKRLEAEVIARTGELKQTVSFLELAQHSLITSYQATVEVFSNLIDMRKQLGANSRQVAEHAVQLGQLLSISKEESQQLRYAALLRNIGKLGLEDSLLDQSLSSMKQSEHNTFCQHPVIAQGLLMGLEPLHNVAHIIYHQNEQLDGNGYPKQLHNAETPLLSRILKVVGDFHDLQQGIITSTHLDAKEAYDYLVERVNTHYDEKLVLLLKKIITPKNQKEQAIKEERLFPSELSVGMVLSRDLMLNEKVLLLSKGYSLSIAQIGRIQDLAKSIKTDLIIYALKQNKECE